jgi:hypothetical protein
MRRLRGVFLAIAALGFSTHAHAETRVALVIGNSQYANVSPLTNPSNDADAMKSALEAAQFHVEVQKDLDKSSFEHALETFAEEASRADVALIYYAGHGMEAGGTNYLIPVNARLKHASSVDFETVSLNLVLSAVSGAHHLHIVILDACRDNPFSKQMDGASQRGISRGLVAIEPDSDTLVAYAARAGTTADDGDSGDSPFTTALAKQIRTPGIELGLVFRNVRDEVLKKTGGSQEPFVYGSISAEQFFFINAPNAQITLASSPSNQAPDPQVIELEYWRTAGESEDASQIRSYLNHYPKGMFADLAKEKLARLESPSRGLPTAMPSSVQNALSELSERDFAKYPMLLNQPAASITKAAYSAMPLADEFGTHTVRYVWITTSLISAPSIILPACVSLDAYFVWFFDGDGSTVRGFSIRTSPTSRCNGADAPYLQFLRAAGALPNGFASKTQEEQVITHRGLTFAVQGDPNGQVRVDVLEPGIPPAHKDFPVAFIN